MKPLTIAGERCKLPRAFWRSLEMLGLRPAEVLRYANLPVTLDRNESALISTSQFFAVWHAIEAVSGDPAFSIRMVSETSTARHKIAFLAASYANNFRDGLARVARFKRLCSPDRIRLEEREGNVAVTIEWPIGTEPEPPLSVDANFALLIELGRRGTGRRISPVTLDLRRPAPPSDPHHEYFGCPIRYGAKHDKMVLSTAHLDLPFNSSNAEMLALVTPALALAMQQIEWQASLADQVKSSLKRAMSMGAPDIAFVARELGLSQRTLQRRITADGQTFRGLLTAARHEMSLRFLADAAIDIKEIAYLLGYDDSKSFHRAFRQWEDVTPSQWRRRFLS